MNPAHLSSALSGLFPANVIVTELRSPGNPALLMPKEAAYVGKALPKRVQEFAAGRLCARRALAEFDIVDFPIEVAVDRQPIWPASVCGSITHTDGFCAAVVARGGQFRSLGIDVEIAGSVKHAIWPNICVARELAWLESLAASQRARAVTLIFSAKEAFYKCQYPLVRERLGFHDVCVEATEEVATGGIFSIAATRDIEFSKLHAAPFYGRYLCHDEFVTAGIGVGIGFGAVAAPQ